MILIFSLNFTLGYFRCYLDEQANPTDCRDIAYHMFGSECFYKSLYSQWCYRFDVYINYLALAMYMVRCLL